VEDVEQMRKLELQKPTQTGEYFIALPIGRYYAYYADVKGYYSIVNYLDLTAAEAYKEMTTDVNLVSVEELQNSGKTIKLIIFSLILEAMH
jgi:hypothetical protein